MCLWCVWCGMPCALCVSLTEIHLKGIIRQLSQQFAPNIHCPTPHVALTNSHTQSREGLPFYLNPSFIIGRQCL